MQRFDSLTLAPGTAATAPFNLPVGVAPINPVEGDVWRTSAGLYVFTGGVTVGPLGAGGGGGGDPQASITELNNAAASRVISPSVFWGAQAPVALTDAPTVALDLASGQNFTLTLGGNRTLGNPTNLKPGQAGSIFVTLGATAYTLSFASNYVFDDLATAPVLNLNGVTELRFKVTGDGKVRLYGGKPSVGGGTTLRKQTLTSGLDGAGGDARGIYYADVAQTITYLIRGSGGSNTAVLTKYAAASAGNNYQAAGSTVLENAAGNGTTGSTSLAVGEILVFRTGAGTGYNYCHIAQQPA